MPYRRNKTEITPVNWSNVMRRSISSHSWIKNYNPKSIDWKQRWPNKRQRTLKHLGVQCQHQSPSRHATRRTGLVKHWSQPVCSSARNRERTSQSIFRTPLSISCPPVFHFSILCSHIRFFLEYISPEEEEERISLVDLTGLVRDFSYAFATQSNRY